MSDAAFIPTVFFKQDCPFCLKVRIFLLESGLLGSVKVKEFATGSAEETAIRQELATHLETISLPTAELVPGAYLSDSDTIIAALAGKAGVDVSALATYRAYVEGPLQRMQSLYRENLELKKQQA